MGDFKRNSKFGGGRASGSKGGFQKGFGSQNKFGRGADRAEKELFRTTCTECGKSCEVPFKPTGQKPVLCRECYAQNAPANDRPVRREYGFNKPSAPSFRPRPEGQGHTPGLQRSIDEIGMKLDKLIQILSPQSASKEQAPKVSKKSSWKDKKKGVKKPLWFENNA